MPPHRVTVEEFSLLSLEYSTIWLRSPDLHHLTGLDREQSLRTGGQERQQILHAIRFRAKDQDGQTPPGHVLLVFDISIAGEKYIPSALSKRQEFAGNCSRNSSSVSPPSK